MRIAFFEDHAAVELGPIAMLRPVFELVCGRFSLRERLLRVLPVTEWGVFLRPELAEVYSEQFPECHVNDFLWLARGPTTLINGRWLPGAEDLKHFEDDAAGCVGETVVRLRVEPLEAPVFAMGDSAEAASLIAGKRERVAASGRTISRPWDLVDGNGRQLMADDALVGGTLGIPTLDLFGTRDGDESAVTVIGDPRLVRVASTARIEPQVVFDTRQGPISIDEGVIVQAFTRIEGPCHVGQGSRLFRANIRGGTTIGPECRVGGELDSTILHGFVNKAHDGFLGHAYVCPWVNFGALSSNSDLKNDYSHVSVPLLGRPIDTGLTKVGSFIGDHTKTGLSSLFNTGSSVGVMSLILPGGELLPKFIPSFATVWHGELAAVVSLEHSLQTARVAMARRNHELTPAQTRLLRWLHSATAREREDAIARFREKRRPTGNSVA